MISADGSDRPGADEVPALGAAPALKLGVFYGAFVITALVSVLMQAGDLPFYLVLLLLFAGIPILGHQTIGLTPYRSRTRRIRLFWTLGAFYPVVVLTLGVWLVLRLRPVALSARDEIAVQRTALLALFVSREHAKQLVFWNDRANVSPSLQLLRASGLPVEAQLPDTAALAMPMPVHLETLETLEQHFRARPDGWEAWFSRYPASSGIVALSRPMLLSTRADGDELVAVVVARNCGEHCHSAWRVMLSRRSGARWQIRSVEPLTLPLD